MITAEFLTEDEGDGDDGNEYVDDGNESGMPRSSTKCHVLLGAAVEARTDKRTNA